MTLRKRTLSNLTEKYYWKHTNFKITYWTENLILNCTVFKIYWISNHTENEWTDWYLQLLRTQNALVNGTLLARGKGKDI